MAPKGHSLNKILCFLAIIALSGCNNSQKNNQSLTQIAYRVDTAKVPHDTVIFKNPDLVLNNGVYFYKNRSFSGIIKELYPNGVIKSYKPVLNGMTYGLYKSYFENGNLSQLLMYKNNISTGRHIGFWEDGKTPRFDYNYYNEKMEGVQKKFYASGKPFLKLNYLNDHEVGLQQGWRENGKLFINYEVKNGIRYGLQKSVLCYTLKNEKLK